MRVLALAALVGLLLFAVRAADFDAFARTVRHAQPLWLLLALGLQLATYSCVALGWSQVLSRAGAPQPLRRLIKIAFCKLFADQVMPGAGLGGDVVLVDRLTALGCPRGAAMAALLVSMVGYYAAYAVLALLMLLLLWLHDQATPLLAGVVTMFLLVALAIPSLALWLRARGSRPLPPPIERVPVIARLLQAVGEAPRELTADPRLIARVAACNAMVFLADAATLETCLLALGHPTAIATAFIALISASIVTTLAPLPLGLGSFEAGCAGMLTLLGVPLAIGLAATLLLRGLILWLPLLPGLFLMRDALFRGRESGG